MELYGDEVTPQACNNSELEVQRSKRQTLEGPKPLPAKGIPGISKVCKPLRQPAHSRCVHIQAATLQIVCGSSKYPPWHMRARARSLSVQSPEDAAIVRSLHQA